MRRIFCAAIGIGVDKCFLLKVAPERRFVPYSYSIPNLTEKILLHLDVFPILYYIYQLRNGAGTPLGQESCLHHDPALLTDNIRDFRRIENLEILT